VSHEVKKKYRS